MKAGTGAGRAESLTFASPLLNFSVVQLLHAQRILTTKEESVSVGK